MFGSMPWSSFPWHKLLTRLGQSEYLSSLNLIHEFTSLFSPKVYNFCRFAQEGLPRKQAFVDISVFLWLRKQQPRFAKGQPKGYFQMQELDRTAEVIVPMNEVWKKFNANMRQYVPLHGNMGQHCCLSAAQRKTAFVEQS